MIDLMPEQAAAVDPVGGEDPVPAAPDGLDAVDEQLIARPAGRARADGMQVTGEGGLLAQLTKRLVKSAPAGEIADHLGYREDICLRGDGAQGRRTRRETERRNART